MKDFSRPRSTTPIDFRIDNDVFYAVPNLNADQQLKAIGLMNSMGSAQLEGIAIERIDPVNATVSDVDRANQIAVTTNTAVMEIMGMLDELLLPDSAVRFAERMKSKTEPIDLAQVIDVFQYLVGMYGDRPTSPPSSSSNGHGGTGTSSTEDTQPSASTPSPYPSTVS